MFCMWYHHDHDFRFLEGIIFHLVELSPTWRWQRLFREIVLAHFFKKTLSSSRRFLSFVNRQVSITSSIYKLWCFDCARCFFVTQPQTSVMMHLFWKTYLFSPRQLFLVFEWSGGESRTGQGEFVQNHFHEFQCCYTGAM